MTAQKVDRYTALVLSACLAAVIVATLAGIL